MRRTRRSHYPTPIGHIIENVINRYNFGPRLTEGKISALWDGAVGDGVARHAQPERLRGKTLHVVVSNSTWKQELSFMKEMIVNKLNSRIGQKAVDTISFRVGAVVRPSNEKKVVSHEQPVELEDARLKAIEEALKGVTDLDLRRALTDLRIKEEKARHSKETVKAK